MKNSAREFDNSYDELPYPSFPLAYTQPDHLATMAAVLGVASRPSSSCRVLELGCASGGNLIPMAFALPDSEFVGIDLSGRQVATGRQTIQALRLTNITLQRLSILDVDERLGEFDYIICHGVYSWVPEEVQEKIMAICAERLAPHGVGYISYNTYPGWHMRGMLRDMMYYHVHRFPDQSPELNVSRARALLSFLTRSVSSENNPYGLLLKQNLDQLKQHPDSYLFHEYLEDCNSPAYFLEFCERLARHDLRYLGEAEFHVMAGTAFPRDVQGVLSELAPRLIEKEQYMDFLRNRLFRQTLVCHSNVQPDYEVSATKVTEFHIASALLPVATASNLDTETAVEFKNSAGLTLTTSSPIVKAALSVLGEAWPRAIAFDTLRLLARKRLSAVPCEDAELSLKDSHALAKALLTAYATAGSHLVEFSLHPPIFCLEVSQRPVASPLARLQARGGSSQVTNLRHQVVELSHFDRHLLPLLDGTRNHGELLEGLMERFAGGDLHVSKDEVAITDTDGARVILAEVLAQQLPKLVASALLVG